MCAVELPVRAPSCARDRDRNYGTSGRRLKASGIPMSSRTRQILGRVRKPSQAL